MVNIHWVSEIKNGFFATKKKRYITISCILGLFLFLLIKSCSLAGNSLTTYTIGQDSHWPGIDLMGKERNFTAFSTNLLSAIAKREHLRIHIVNTPSNELLSNLDKGILQGIFTDLQPSQLNETRFVFSEPYFLFGPVLVIRQTAPAKGWNEMAKKIVGVQSNSPTILNLEQDPSIQIKLYDDILNALSDLNERRIDGVVFPALQAHTYVNAFYKHDLKVVSLPLNNEGARLVALNNEAGQQLIKLFNDGLANLKQKGTYHHLIDQWGLVNVEKVDP